VNVPGLPEFVWLWARHQGHAVPRVHMRIAEWLAACWRRGERNLLLTAFRGAGKSSLLGVFAAWLLGRDPDLRILVVAAEQPLAVKMVGAIRAVVEQHPVLPDLRPRRRQQWAADRLTVARPTALRDPSVLGQGITGNLTGARADVIIGDDVEVPNTADTPAKRADLRERLLELDYILTPGGMQLYAGTPHTSETIYATEARGGETEPFMRGFNRLRIPLLDAAGRSAWPERFPPEHIAELRRRSGPNRFASQMQLEPRALHDSRLEPDRLVPYEAPLAYREGNRRGVLTLMDRRLVSASCWWDPAYGAPERGDASVIAAVFADDAGNYYLHRVAYLTHDPAQTAAVDEATQLCRQAAAFAEALYLPAIGVETNGLGRFLPGLLRRELGRRGVPCAVTEHAQHRPKAARILEAFDAPLAAGVLHAHASVWDTPFIQEMRAWRPDAAGQRDDGLDAAAAALAAEPVRLPRHAPAGRRTWPGGAGAAPGRFDV